MPKDAAYKKAEKKIAEALQSGATEVTIQHPFFHSLFVENQGGNHDA